MANKVVKFYRGLSAAYNPTTHTDGIFFTTFRSLSTDNKLAFRGIVYTSFVLVMRKGFEPLNSAVKGR